MTTLYTAKAKATAGREGNVETSDKQLVAQLSVPGSNKPGLNPELLFASGYAACFGSAVMAAAKMQQVEIGAPVVESEVGLNKDESGYFINAVLNVSVPGVDDATAHQLVQVAHQLCPYSKATRGNIDVQLKVNNAPLKKAA